MHPESMGDPVGVRLAVHPGGSAITMLAAGDSPMSTLDSGFGGGWSPGFTPGRGPRGEDPARLLVALVDVTGPRLWERLAEVVGAAHAASRRGSVVVVAPQARVGEVEAQVAETAERSGLGELGLRVVSEERSREALSRHSFVTYTLSDAGGLRVAVPGGGAMELLPLDTALEQLWTMGRGPASKQGDPVFTPLPQR
ncbi:MAG: hypothetical protein WD960_08195 [Gemmatimonadota bacterium]